MNKRFKAAGAILAAVMAVFTAAACGGGVDGQFRGNYRELTAAEACSALAQKSADVTELDTEWTGMQFTMKSSLNVTENGQPVKMLTDVEGKYRFDSDLKASFGGKVRTEASFLNSDVDMNLYITDGAVYLRSRMKAASGGSNESQETKIKFAYGFDSSLSVDPNAAIAQFDPVVRELLELTEAEIDRLGVKVSIAEKGDEKSFKFVFDEALLGETDSDVFGESSITDAACEAILKFTGNSLSGIKLNLSFKQNGLANSFDYAFVPFDGTISFPGDLDTYQDVSSLTPDYGAMFEGLEDFAA